MVSPLKLSKNPEYHERSKHVEVRHSFVREKYLSKEIRIEHIEGKSQLADAMTKALERIRFQRLRREFGLKPSAGSERVLRKSDPAEVRKSIKKNNEAFVLEYFTGVVVFSVRSSLAQRFRSPKCCFATQTYLHEAMLFVRRLIHD